jgi:predicted nucleic acid-binding protein
MRTVVCDAGPVIHLHEAGLLHLLNFCGSIHIPALVHEEICANTNLESIWPGWIEVVRLNYDAIKHAAFLSRLGDLHGGESEAFVLCADIKANWLLTDDAAARLFAATLGMEVHGSLGVVLWNVAHRHLDQEQGLASLTALSQTSLWLSTRTLQEARTAIIEIGVALNA